MDSEEKLSPKKLSTNVMRVLQGFFKKEEPQEIDRLRQLQMRKTGEYDHVTFCPSVHKIISRDLPQTKELPAAEPPATTPHVEDNIEQENVEQPKQEQANRKPRQFHTLNCKPPIDQDFEPKTPDHPFTENELSISAKHEVLRLELTKRDQIARSLGTPLTGTTDTDSLDSLLVDEWKTSGSHALVGQDWNTSGSYALLSTQELSPVEQLQLVSQSQEDAPARPPVSQTDTIPPASMSQEVPLPARPTFNSPSNPYRNYSDTALTLIAQNPSTSRATLMWLSLHTNNDIRSAVARNSNCPPESLALLARDREAGIRHAIADNPRCSIAILEMLAIDKNPLIAWRAQNSLNLARGRKTVTDLRPPGWKAAPPRPPEMTRTGHNLPISDELTSTEETISFLRLIALKTNTPPRRLAELARHPDTRVRAAVAENANTPLELLWLLAKDQNTEVKLKITENYNCPLAVLETLKDDVDPYVAWQARSVLHRLTNASQPNPYMDNGSISRPHRAVTSRELL